MSTWSAESAPWMKTLPKNEFSPDQSQPFARWMRIFGLPAALAPFMAEWSSCETGLMPLDEICPTGQRKPPLISLPTCSMSIGVPWLEKLVTTSFVYLRSAEWSACAT